jgi:hypothetical protein
MVTGRVGLRAKEVIVHIKSAMTLIALLGSRAVRVRETTRDPTVSAATQDVTLATDQLALLGLTVSAATQDVTLATGQLGLLGQRGSAAIREEIHQIAQPGLHVSTQRIRQPMILPSPIQRIVTTARVTERIDPQLTSDLHAVRIPVAQVVLQSANL